MTEKKFGVGSMESLESQEQKQEVFTEAVNQVVGNPFGTGATTKQPTSQAQPTFGVGTDSQGQKSLGMRIKAIFSEQQVMFWVLAYLLSLAYFVMVDARPLFGWLNLILFPFAALLCGNFSGHYLNFSAVLADLFYPSYKTKQESWGLIAKVLWGILKFYLFSFIWSVSFVLGLYNLISLLNQSKRNRL